MEALYVLCCSEPTCMATPQCDALRYCEQALHMGFFVTLPAPNVKGSSSSQGHCTDPTHAISTGVAQRACGGRASQDLHNHKVPERVDAQEVGGAQRAHGGAAGRHAGRQQAAQRQLVAQAPRDKHAQRVCALRALGTLGSGAALLGTACGGCGA